MSQDLHKMEQKLSMKNTKGKKDIDQIAMNYTSKMDAKLNSTVIKHIEEIKEQILAPISSPRKKSRRSSLNS